MKTTTNRVRKNSKRPLHPTGKLIKQLRKASGYTQDEIKNILGFQATSAISKIESRDFIPDLMRLQKLLALINPTKEQKNLILDYYGYSESELPNKHDFVGTLKIKAQKGDILSALNTLFFLFVYKKDYTALSDTVQDLFHQNFYIPQAVRMCSSEVEMLVQEIFSSRRLLAQGMLSKQSLGLEEALQRVEMANQLLKLIRTRFDKKLNPEAKLFLSLLSLHVSFCAENIYYGLQYRTHKNKKFSTPGTSNNIPAMRDVLAAIETQFPEYNMQEIRQMALYIEREALTVNLLKDQEAAKQILSSILNDFGVQSSEPIAANWREAIKKNNSEKVFSKVWENFIKARGIEHKFVKQSMYDFQQLMQLHQQVTNWDGSTAHTAIVMTFLGYPVVLARLGHFAWAQDMLNLLYFQLTVSETHYQWLNSQALVMALEYIHTTELSTKKQTSELKLGRTQELAIQFAKTLQKIVQELRDTKSLNSPVNIRYTFSEEPLFYLALLHAKEHSQLKKMPELQEVFGLLDQY